MTAHRTFIYVDGFNLYYGSLRGTPYKWLNLEKLCQLMLPANDIQRIKYYTARVSSRPKDLLAPQRQQVYMRALKTLSSASIHYGHFLQSKVWMPLVAPLPDGQQFALVTKTEEKGSDVNLATDLLNDAHLNRYDVAVVVSNDSDLLAPIKLVRSELGKIVGILNPQEIASRVLAEHANFLKPIRPEFLRQSQFPYYMTDMKGKFHKPPSWT